MAKVFPSTRCSDFHLQPRSVTLAARCTDLVAAESAQMRLMAGPSEVRKMLPVSEKLVPEKLVPEKLASAKLVPAKLVSEQ